MKLPWKFWKRKTRLCDECNALCCRYVAIEIDEPTTRQDYDHISWYLLHRNVQIFVDHEGSWYVEFITPCEKLGTDNRCQIYNQRPKLCRSHGTPPEVCELVGSPYAELFQTPEDFQKYLSAKRIKRLIKKKDNDE